MNNNQQMMRAAVEGSSNYIWPVPNTILLKIGPVWIIAMHVCVCVCPHPRLLITGGMIWHDMDLIRLVKQVLQLLYGNCSHYR